ncbi:chemotaxis protein [Idiomarina tyrosinivorans]|uniref:Chemotaxis protein n=1 Tax=Idiomarina tyrosinivorans TaxID=1445662 RepID=A0A432ZQH4_9GAMM|nr:methyl-accepting chemotaxis protein [Idiomarina tyrosinivorans]RUO80149.1 chemotaxis protein [Idiomarina tyrosinivorans]
MKLVHKLFIAFATIVVVLGALITAVMMGIGDMTQTNQRSIHSFEVIGQADDLYMSLLNIESGQRGYVITGNEDFLQPYVDGTAEVEKALANLKNLVKDSPKQLELLKKIEDEYQYWLTSAVEPPIEIRKSYGPGSLGLDQSAAIVAQGRGKAGMDNLREFVQQFTKTEKSLLLERADAASAAATLAQTISIGGGLLVIIIAVLSAWVFKRQLEQRLEEAMRVATAVADGRLNNQIDDDGKDEIGELLSALAAMQTQLRSMLQQIIQSSNELNSSSQSVASTAEELSASSTEQTDASESIATSVQQLSASISHVADNANEARTISEQSSTDAEQSAKTMERMVNSMNRINQAVNEASAQVVELGKQSEQINSIVNVIKSIADQTNLLALNAAIEAARAGEQGRGFSVVADEVRTLAQRTSASTDEIESMVALIQQGTQASVAQMEKGVTEVEQGVQLAGDSGEAIREIRVSFDRVLAVVEDISSALSEQNQASAEVAQHVERFSSMAEQNQEATRHTSSTAHQLQGLAEKLKQAVSRFTL